MIYCETKISFQQNYFYPSKDYMQLVCFLIWDSDNYNDNNKDDNNNNTSFSY